ncbi:MULTISPECIES: type II toxin-antitoxin system prevent-host-death family antitoxin [Actinobacillus]|uniref:Antitoxin n=1 Tax=Actinobacillus minor NM305 TaxID=637911 RepID=C5S1X3_9PAST|nr:MULTISPECIES: type II toxin-antitoxin system prevent-host-death family antitoxin [Actinobacillus]EER47076.1 prevent-host-death family protein/antitoxin of toxin-antitoxin stability system [Actinobacillus minor NM305]MDD7545688.1 type II toxin-antitoxin system prevent-host-death family antitoxin [Actinobacillus porcinus]MDY5848952.1 type II toxin-antitoxin system prevent-host-death family antitoxin [Actinobacillus porcinus]
MPIMTSREFNQRSSQAQKYALEEPVIITNRGTPAFVLMSYTEYEKVQQAKPFRSALEALLPIDNDDVELELQPRSRAQRRPVDLDD